jgi:hypothetical protein
MYRLENFSGAAGAANLAASPRSIWWRVDAKKIRARGADFGDAA